jgi:hypothetical protein
MKKLALVFIFFFSAFSGIACEVCKKQQPKYLENITHGAGPISYGDYAIVLAMTAISVLTLGLSVRSLLTAKREGSSHIKFEILKID